MHDGVEAAGAAARPRTGPRCARRGRAARGRSRRELARLDADARPSRARAPRRAGSRPSSRGRAARPGGDVALDRARATAPRGRPLAGLLLDVVLRRRLARRPRRARPRSGIALELHVPAARAADDVRERGAEAGRWSGSGPSRPGVAGDARGAGASAAAPQRGSAASAASHRGRLTPMRRWRAVGRHRCAVTATAAPERSLSCSASSPRATTRRRRVERVPRAASRAALEGVPFELVLVDDGSTDATAAAARRARRPRPARAGRPPVAQLRPPGGAHRRPRPRPRRRRRDDRRRPPGPARADPRDARALAQRRRRRLRRPRARARARRASSSSPRAGSTASSHASPQLDLQPNAGDFRLLDRRALDALLRDARAQPLPARDDGLGRLHADRGRLRARRALRGRDQVHAAADAALLARRDLVVLARAAAGWRRCSASSSRRSPSSAIPVAIGFRIAGQFVPGVTHGAARGAAARRDPADHGRDHRRVRRPHLRRGQAAAAVRGPRAAQHGAERGERVDAEPRREPASRADEGRGRSAPASPAWSAALPARRARATRSTSTSAGPGSAARRRRSTSATGSLLERYYHHLFTSDRHIAALYEELGMADAIEWLPVERRDVRRRARCTRSRRPLDLLRFSRCRCARACGWALAVAAAAAPRRRTSSRTSARPRATGSSAEMGDDAWDGGLGPAAARQVRRPRRRDLDGLAVEQAHAAPAGRAASEARRSCSATRAAAGEPLFDGAARRRSRPRGGRVLIDRPAARLGARGRRRLHGRHRGAPGLVPRAATTRARSSRRRGRALRRGARDGARRTSSTRCSTTACARRSGAATSARLRSIEYHDGALPAARARPAVRPLLLDQRRRRRRCRSSA